MAVDFDDQIDRNKKNILLYSQLIATIVKRENLKPFLAEAIAQIIDFSSRHADDNQKLSTHIRIITDIILESAYWSELKNKKAVDANDIRKALSAYVHRMDRSKDLYYEDITRGFIIIHTSGKLVGQMNCLSVRRVGSLSYGHPTRVTARVRAGNGKILDIQRQINMAGPMHSKAMLTITNFLASKFSPNQLFSLSASISFEQVYVWTDGDSASVGELCALLSALADIPLHQHLAVTGSIDQYGQVQAIGGVNEKIEGFYDVCKEKNFTKKQGVIIPAINQQNLMLREDIVEAVKRHQFFIYPIETIDEAIMLLTNRPAGLRDATGQFTVNSIYSKIEERLKQYAKRRKKQK